MIISMFYLCVTIISLCAMWAIWVFGFKSLFLAIYRARLFELRNHLFSLGERGKLSFDDETYRTLELLLNGLIQYAHRLTFPGFILSTWYRAHAKLEKDYVDFAQVINLNISRLDPDVRDEVNSIYSRISTAICLYLFGTSLIYKFAVMCLFIAWRFKIRETREQFTQHVFVFEREAYVAAKQRHTPA